MQIEIQNRNRIGKKGNNRIEMEQQDRNGNVEGKVDT